MLLNIVPQLKGEKLHCSVKNQRLISIENRMFTHTAVRASLTSAWLLAAFNRSLLVVTVLGSTVILANNFSRASSLGLSAVPVPAVVPINQ